MIRPATSRDVDAMAGLAEGKRQAYADGPHGFHRSGPDARAVHAPFLARLLGRPDFLTLVHEDAAAVDGFLIARMGSAPPPFGAGPLFHVDDFVVAEERLWPSAGVALLVGAARSAADRGAGRVIVVAGPPGVDPAKTAMLIGLGFKRAAEWHVKRISPEPGGAAAEQRGFEAVVGPAPPVYDPGGPICLAESIDGSDDLAALESYAAASSAVLVVVPVEAERGDLRAALGDRGYDVASEWYSGPVAGLAT